MDDERLATRSWKVGTTVITSVVEDQIDHIPPEFFFAGASGEAVRRHRWLVPDYADDDGNVDANEHRELDQPDASKHRWHQPR